METEEIRMTIRFPKKVAYFLDRLAKERFTSRNAQIVRLLVEKMEQSDATQPTN